MVAQYRKEKAKGDNHYKDLKWFLSAFLNLKKNFSCLISAGRRFHILTALTRKEF